MTDDNSNPDRRTVLRTAGSLAAAGAVGSTGALAQETGSTLDGSAAQEPISTLSISGGVAEGVVSDDQQTAYVAIDQGFVSVDITDPQNPTELARRTDTGMSEVLDVKTAGDRVIAVGPGNYGSPSGMGLYDTSDPANPELLEWYETSYTIHNSVMTEDIAFLINNSAAQIHLIDISNDNPSEITNWGLSGASILHDIWWQDDILWMAYWDDGTVMLDVSDPSNPSMIGKVRDGSDRYPNNDHYVILTEDASTVAIGKEQLGGNPLGIELWDVSDKTDTTHLADIEPPSVGSERTSHNLDIKNGHLYSSWYNAGVTVHDITDPASPEEVYHWRSDDSSFWTAKVGVPGEFFIGTDEGISGGNNRLFVFPDPADGGGDNQPPMADFDVSNQNPTVGESVEFDGSASSDPDGSITSYEWSFGDGSMGSGMTATHSYSSTGMFTAELTVTDDAGATDTTTQSLTVEEGGGDCGAESASGSADGFLAWWNTEEVSTYSTQTANPCGVTVELEGPGFANFDLYVTYDGRTPTRDDYDDRSAGSGANESVSGDLSGSTDVGILVAASEGWGDYSVSISEDGA
ncbi:PKD domain-containing protein [Halovivax limisalsi]|uniref:PKD domain-containing protein n=1 Tax=Halovivax limisalsi TaxID=1453760 RepID=UPI001FFD95ED|nr:PKD domain-containing protein [Halovivax limisalsi]